MKRSRLKRGSSSSKKQRLTNVASGNVKKLYEILLIPKEEYHKPVKLLNKDEKTYLHNLEVFRKAEREGKVEIVFSGIVSDKESQLQYRLAENKMKRVN
jgi:hypothetical protein